MKNKIITIILAAMIALGGSFALADKHPVNTLPKPAVKAEESKPAPKMPEINPAEYQEVSSLSIAAAPNTYMNKKVKMKAVFDKFSTLGLDYKPAFRDSQKYISFLIKRDDVKDHTVPLSEMKIFILRTEAEKFIDLESGDVIEIYGKVFSTALGDPWVDVDKLTIIEKKVKKDKEKA